MAKTSSIISPKNRPGNVKFDKIWNRAKDCDVASVVLHSNGGTLCMDDMHALTADEVIDCCNHGCIIKAEHVYYRPVFWMVEGDVAGVNCIMPNSSGNTTPLLRTFYSYRAD